MRASVVSSCYGYCVFIQDKTFGLKNKKGKKQQQFIKHVTNQVKFGGSSQQKREADEFQAKVSMYMYITFTYKCGPWILDC